MTASVHKLTAGSGYDYLTRQVAAQDSTEKGHLSLASYYSEKGEVPGTWWGSGLAGLGDVAVGDQVSAEQMKALFGGGFHPNEASRLAALPADASPEEIRAASRLGTPFPVYSGATDFRKEVAIRCSEWEAEHPGVGEVPVGVRSEIRNDIAKEHFREKFRRIPSPLELSSAVAKLSRDPSTACAGYDVTFTPVKSVSALWAVAPVELAARIEEAHNAAVADALRFLERRALFTRCGHGGVRQVDVIGLLAATFVHRDSRAGDPNLHTHVAIANKVQTLDGKWLAIDGRLIFKAMVAVSETYNTQLEAHLAKLGIRFDERPGTEQGKRPVREVVGVPAALLERWSSRRVAIVARQGQLAARFQQEHGRPPTPVEAIKLAQQATLETRDAKHKPRRISQQRAAWWAEALQVIGERGIHDLVAAATTPPAESVQPITNQWVNDTAREVVAAMEGGRTTWQVWHLRAEASRRVREVTIDPETTKVVTEALLSAAVRLSTPVGNAGADGIAEPTVLRRREGASVYTVAGSQLFTSRKVLEAESRIVDLAGRTDGRRVGELEVSLALLASTANGITLNAGQTNMVRQMATSGTRVQLALAAAGSGKTTALKVLAEAWREGGGTVLGLAPSAVAASILRDQTGDATTIAKYVWDLKHGRSNEVNARIGPDTLVIIDEAGMVDTISLATVIDHVVSRGGSVRLVGDDQQLAAISAGGVLRDIAEVHGAVELNELLRFQDPAEANASLALRDGRPEALGFYLDAERIHAGTQESGLEAAFNDWARDRAAGLDSLMLAGTRDTVTDLNRRARAHRLITTRATGHDSEVVLADANHASVGDVIVTRLNDRRLAISATDWVKNGDRWVVQRVTNRGVVRARHCDSGLTVNLPADYVHKHVQLGYAVTVHAAQGLTVDVTRGVLTGQETRQQLYVMATRGRQANHLYVPIVGDGDEHSVVHPTTLRPETAVDVLQTVLARDGSARSPPPKPATSLHRRFGSPTLQPGTSMPSTSLWRPPSTLTRSQASTATLIEWWKG